MNRQDFYAGKVFDAYRFFGAHPAEEGGIVFRTYAPNAAGVAVIGDFSGWSDIPMEQEYQTGIYSCRVAQAEIGMKYKIRVYKRDGSFIDHSDPYGFGMELRPAHSSIITDLSGYDFHDSEWMDKRENHYDKPLNIYEVHLGSWRTNTSDKNGWYTYSGVADSLIEYVKENNFNYIEFMPLSEHPADESWGYQNTGFFSPTSRYGSARDLMELVDKCHQAGIGVIMDFVPVHFALDDYGLANFDGTALYEYPHNDVGKSEWGSHNFIHSRGDVRSFLQSAANYWLTEYHFDGIRVDAVSRMIYWQGDPSRGVNLITVDFIRKMNEELHSRHRGAILIAEDSTSYPKITEPAARGGLDFDYKWDLGWMNDTLAYFSKVPEERAELYNKLTFSMMYFYNERYLLPFSHDEVVHGKGTIVNKMNGEYEDKFKQARALYAYMITHPGKKLNFMGNEIGQLREWDEKREQDWNLLKYPIHDSFHKFLISLNQLYLTNDAFYEGDYDPSHFKWADCNYEGTCVYVFQRTGKEKRLWLPLIFPRMT
ncbi:1,4-alpha-glucan branching protein GlgB [Brucepastera parasyntrophica]|uniref:1,4-alpha-glucan branching protein GlgB n=1 Tax=Brucepastera parasyntrophica TaxID=2880008 RepID=UPI002109BC0A|nr:1,4-alpha-glucan branching protein GlgB [Brucepastera parasyntrophica]ULQ59252.1 1,4-alpha-glucan branching protein GlgB [Brucepastera parasyntrophica]